MDIWIVEKDEVCGDFKMMSAHQSLETARIRCLELIEEVERKEWVKIKKYEDCDFWESNNYIFSFRISQMMLEP